MFGHPNSIASSLDDFVGQTEWVRKDEFVAAGHLYEAVRSQPARHSRVQPPFTRWHAGVLGADQVASRRGERVELLEIDRLDKLLERLG